MLWAPAVFAQWSTEGRQEVTLYESYEDAVQEMFVQSSEEGEEVVTVRSVPSDLGDVRIDRRGRIVTSSIRKYSFNGLPSLCSLAVKLFLQEVTRATPIQWVSDQQNRLRKGDAIRLIQSWIDQGMLQPMPWEYRALRRFLTTMRNQNPNHSLFDIYLHTPNDAVSYESDAWYMQGHRIVVFLGSDAHWYVYDPFVDPFTTEPQRLRSYVENDLWQNAAAYTLPRWYSIEWFEHGVADNSDSLQERVNLTLDTIHENTLGEVEDGLDFAASVIGVMGKRLSISLD